MIGLGNRFLGPWFWCILGEMEPYELYDYFTGRCMVRGCGQERWTDPEKGKLVLCKEHAEEVDKGYAKAPPLRAFRDYDPVGRKPFVLEPADLPPTWPLKD